MAYWLCFAKTSYASKPVDCSSRWRHSCRPMLNAILLGFRLVILVLSGHKHVHGEFVIRPLLVSDTTRYNVSAIDTI